MAWNIDEKKRLVESKKVDSDKWEVCANDHKVVNGDPVSLHRFPGFFAFVLVGQTRQGSTYSSIWWQNEDEKVSGSRKGGDSHAAMKDAEGGKQAKQKREADEWENERKKRREEEDKNHKHKIIKS